MQIRSFSKFQFRIRNVIGRSKNSSHELLAYISFGIFGKLNAKSSRANKSWGSRFMVKLG